MEIKVGDYVRTKYGIARIKSKNYKDENDVKCLVVDKELEHGYIGGCDEHLCDYKDIIGKPSSNIIDLIDVGDYVNGYKVSKIGEDYQKYIQCDYAVQNGSTNHYRFSENSICLIVTKEQFSSMEYKK